LLSVIIPALNSASTISRTLSSIFSNKFSEDLFEVLMIDNGSTDNTVEIAKKYDVTVYRCEPRGIGPPRNLGIRKAKGDIVCFTDSDCIVDNCWLQKFHDFFERNPEVDGVGGPTFPYPVSQNRLQELTGELFVDEHNYPKSITKLQHRRKGPLLFGSNSAYKKEALLDVGGFPEPGGSCWELSWKLLAAQHSLVFNPEITVFHIFPSTFKSVYRMYFRWGFQFSSMQKRYRGESEAINGIFFSGYNIAKLWLSLCSLKVDAKKILRLNQAVTYFVGRLSGLTDA